MPAVKPNSLQRRFTYFSALARSFCLASTIYCLYFTPAQVLPTLPRRIHSVFASEITNLLQHSGILLKPMMLSHLFPQAESLRNLLFMLTNASLEWVLTVAKFKAYLNLWFEVIFVAAHSGVADTEKTINRSAIGNLFIAISQSKLRL